MLLLGLDSNSEEEFKKIPPGFHYSNYQTTSEVLSRVSCWGSLVPGSSGGKILKGQGVRTDGGRF